MDHAPVQIGASFRETLGISLVKRLRQLGGFVLTVGVTGTHVHLLVKMPCTEAHRSIGLAKKHAWFEMRDVGWNRKLWAKRGKVGPIRDRHHQRNCFAYIVRHIHQDAWVWVWEGIDDEVLCRILAD